MHVPIIQTIATELGGKEKKKGRQGLEQSRVTSFAQMARGQIPQLRTHTLLSKHRRGVLSCCSVSPTYYHVL